VIARGRFITIEGGEGAGKSTQTLRLVFALEQTGLKVMRTREPGGAPGAEDIRKLLVAGEPGRWLPTTEALLHFAARIEHVERLIKPALAAGTWVVSDRFFDSTMAYQGYGHRLGADFVSRLRRLTLGTFRPDLTIILDLPAERGLARTRTRGGTEDRYERMDLAFHRRLRNGFLAIARSEPRRCVVVSARAPEEQVWKRLREVVRTRMRLTLP
jgi:dTMP kinase